MKMRLILNVLLMLFALNVSAETILNFSAENQGYFVVYKNDVQVSQHTQERKAQVAAANLLLADPAANVYYRQDLKVVGTITITSAASEQSVKLTWTAPTARVNGQALAAGEIAKYIINVNGTNQDVTALTNYSTVLEPGPYTFKVAAVDSAGLQSDWSAPYSMTVE